MRHDGRAPNQLRPLTIETGFSGAALGSALVSAGRTRVICTASLDPRVPKWLTQGGWLTAEYAMLPGATHPRGRRDPGGRGKEIQRLIGRSLRAAVDLAKLTGPKGPVTLYCDCDVLEADGGTRTASITGAYVALSIAVGRMLARGELTESPLRAPLSAVSVGLVALGDDSRPEPVLDLCYEEDHRAAVDLNVVMLGSGSGLSLVEVQGTAEAGTFSRGELNAMLDLAEGGLTDLARMQVDAVERGLRDD
ncbi:MAG: ribonuclease PH [Nannocystaceae bacterium]